tara:strand:- start:1393 stop:3177 length:1785 start_codon:yes stop_codon:yes gene_type:complete
MPQFKFGSNDVFHNVIKAHPKYTISMYLNNLYVNNRLSQGNQVPSGSVSLYEMVIDPNTGSSLKHRDGAGAAGQDIANYFGTASYAYLLSGESGEKVVWSPVVGSTQDFSGKQVLKGATAEPKDYLTQVPKGENRELKSFYPILSKVVERFLIIGNSGSNTAFVGRPDGSSNGLGGINPPYDGITDDPYVATASNVQKLISLKNIFNDYRIYSPYFNFDKYILVSGGIPPVRGFYSKDVNGCTKYPHKNGKCDKTFLENGGGKTNELNTTIGTQNVYEPPGLQLLNDYDASIPNFTQSIPRNKYTNVLVVPKIVYGDQIKRGTVKLEFYFTGTLVARAEDQKQNGELIETYLNPDACDRTTTGSTVGVVMYNEGIFIITSSVPFRAGSLVDGYLSPTGSRGHKCCGADSVTNTDTARPPAGGEGQAMSASYVTASSWAHFGAYKSLVTSSNAHLLSSSRAPCSSSYIMEFRGTTHTPVLTMMAHAKKNELNWSNNPSYISSSNRAAATAGKTAFANSFLDYTSSREYKEIEEIKIKNIVSSSFAGHSSSFRPETFISKIAIYDKDKQLIAVTKLANPVKKTSDQDFTFKMKLDM